MSSKHPDAPLFPMRREYRIAKWPVAGGFLFRVEVKTLILRRWKGISHLYPTRLAAEAEQRAIKFGFPDWMPADKDVVSGRELIRGWH
jgi:hypothetical protein